MNVWVAVYKITWLLIVAVVCLVIAVIFCVPRYAKYKDMLRCRAEMQEQKQLIELRRNRLQENQQKFSTDPAFVERTARSAGMVKSNETVGRLADGPEDTGTRKEQTIDLRP